MKIKPMLCQDAPKAFDDPDYLWEIKFDGARILANVNGQDYTLQARSGTDKTHLFPELEIKTVYPAVLDGELVCCTGKFSDVLHRINRENNIGWATQNYPVFYKVFDILMAEYPGGGQVDLRSQPLFKRKEILQKILVPTTNVRLAEVFELGTLLFEHAQKHQLEGVIGKQKMSRYIEGQRGWLKVKVWQEDKFLAIGYTEGTGWRTSSFGALVLSDLKGNYVGQVGTGFDDESIWSIQQMFQPAPCALQSVPEKATWIKPFMVKVRFLEYTNDHILRFPSFKGVE